MRVGGSVSQSKQTDLGILQRGVLSVTLFLMAINGILGELGNGMDHSLFANDLAIYITTKNQKVATRALQGVTNRLKAWAAERGLTFSTRKTISMTFRKRRKRNEKPLELKLRNETIPLKKVLSSWG